MFGLLLFMFSVALITLMRLVKMMDDSALLFLVWWKVFEIAQASAMKIDAAFGRWNFLLMFSLMIMTKPTPSSVLGASVSTFEYLGGFDIYCIAVGNYFYVQHCVFGL